MGGEAVTGKGGEAFEVQGLRFTVQGARKAAGKNGEAFVGFIGCGERSRYKVQSSR
jgi:hypothetical protein